MQLAFRLKGENDNAFFIYWLKKKQNECDGICSAFFIFSGNTVLPIKELSCIF